MLYIYCPLSKNCDIPSGKHWHSYFLQTLSVLLEVLALCCISVVTLSTSVCSSCLSTNSSYTLLWNPSLQKQTYHVNCVWLNRKTSINLSIFLHSQVFKICDISTYRLALAVGLAPLLLCSYFSTALWRVINFDTVKICPFIH